MRSTRLTVQPIFLCTVQCSNYKHSAGQISGTFSSYTTETLNPLNNHFPFPSSPSSCHNSIYMRPPRLSVIKPGLPWWLRCLRICLQCGRPGFDLWVGKIAWRRAWQPTLIFLPGGSPWTKEPGGLQSMGSQRVRHD